MTAETYQTLAFFRRRRVARDVRLLAAQGQLEVGAVEQLAILVLLGSDEDEEIRTLAGETLARVPAKLLESLQESELPPELAAYRASQRTSAAIEKPNGPDGAVEEPEGSEAEAAAAANTDLDAPTWIDDDPVLQAEGGANREGIMQRLAKMNFSERLKAAMKGSREVRAILIRDRSKLIASSVLKSPKLTEPEVEAFARLGNVAEDVLRTIGNNRAWMKNYGIVLALVKNAKTPLAMSLTLLNRLNDRDVTNLSSDRNVPEPLRVAARKKVVSSVSRR